MKPGDLVLVRGDPLTDVFSLVGKVGLIVKTVRLTASEIFEVLVDGRLWNIHQSYLESIDETG